MAATYRRNRRRRRRHDLRLPAVCAAALLILAGAAWARRDRAPDPADAVVPEYVQTAYLTENPWSRPGIELPEIRGVVIHYVGNPGTSAMANRNYFDSLADGREKTYASSHFVVGLEGEVVQCIPLTEIAYASKERNSDTVAIEVCHPDESGKFSPVTYDRLVELTAWLCEEFRLDPQEDVIRHYDVTGKLCPRYYVDDPAAWDEFRADVAAKLAESTDEG